MLFEVLKQEARLLTFRSAKIRLDQHPWGYLVFALAATWLAGVGRYWDHPTAHWWQYAGLGSVAYIGVLSLVIWGLVAPLRPKHWSFLTVFVFIGLTSPPAWLYAIPVERFMSIDSAATANMWFLLIVAAWRVGLYGVFLRRVAGLKTPALIVCLFLPLSCIVTGLSFLNLEQAVFEIMGGLRSPTTADKAYFIVLLLTVGSWIITPLLAIAYFFEVYKTRHK
ncbi:MAG: hypothetical protein AB8G18_19280 [Gammaproteobacteria bacterium]